MDKQEISERQRLRIGKHPGLVLNDYSDMIIQDIAASFLRKFNKVSRYHVAEHHPKYE